MTRATAIATCFSAAATFVVCAALLAFAALVPPPPAIVPLLVLVGLGMPTAAVWNVPVALQALRSVRDLRDELARIPEVQHPSAILDLRPGALVVFHA